ncbi:hypothetical protein NKI54_35175 [Mesorhizobium sp. M0663]|uniref:hypothetical protein n=1 Tax=Mesorhizobium sp. M0663 TaxID=2956981 RepID=UPI00333A1986
MSIGFSRPRPLALFSAVWVSIPLLTGLARAQVDCSAVLSNHALNIYDSNTVSEYQNAQLDELCKESFSSVGDYNARSRALGSGGSYGAISGFLNLSANDETHSLQEIFNKLCTVKDVATRSWLTSTTHVESADAQLAAFVACVNATNATGIWSHLTLTPGSPDFTIRVDYKMFGQNPLPPLKILDYDHAAGYTCKEGDQDAVNVEVNQPSFALSCKRTATTGIQASINTGLGLIGPFAIPDDRYIALSDRLNQLTADVANATAQSARQLDVKTLSQRAPDGEKPVTVSCPPEYKVVSCKIYIRSGDFLCGESLGADQTTCGGACTLQHPLPVDPAKRPFWTTSVVCARIARQ